MTTEEYAFWLGMFQAVTQAKAPGRFMAKPECADYIGRTPRAVQHMVDRRIIPFNRVDGRLTFDRTKIDAWMEHHAKKGRRRAVGI